MLVAALLAGVGIASLGAGYQATAPDLATGTNSIGHNGGVSQVNSETRRVENEARALASGKQEIEVVVLRDGRTAAVIAGTGEVRLFPPDLGSDTTVTPPQASPPTPGEQPAVVAAKDTGYVIEPNHDTVAPIAVSGPAPAPVRVPGGASRSAAPDGGNGIWVLTDDEKAVHITGNRVIRTVAAAGPIRHITLADGRPVGITEAGAVVDLAAQPLRTIAARPVPAGHTVVVTSVRGTGRYLLVLDRKDGRLVVVDPRTRNVYDAGTLPAGRENDLGAPVVLDDRAYVPAYGKHLLHVVDLPNGTRRDTVEVPGLHPRFALEVRENRVWANDQFDRRVVVVGRDGSPTVIDKGDGADVASDTTHAEEKKPDRTTPPPQPPTSTIPPPTTTTPPRTSRPARPQATVPTIAPGTRQDVACERIRAAGLRCDIVEIGAGGPTGTVRDTNPPGGNRIAEGSVVRVSVYGPVSVPNVIGQLSGAACAKILSGAREPGAGDQLKCAKEAVSGPAATWSDLDVVAEQNPSAGQRVELGTTVTVRHWNTVAVENLAGRNAAEECNRIVTASRNAVTCTVQSIGEAPTPAQAGLVATQSPQAGTPVSIGQQIVLNSYGAQVPRVPPIPVGTEINQACQTVTNAGFTCQPQADVALARSANTVLSQQPPGGTPQQGGAVVLHYSPHQAQALYRFRAASNDPVWIIRLSNAPVPGYGTDPVLIGYAYPGQLAGTATINDFYCTGAPSRCDGYERNHYYTRSNQPDIPNFDNHYTAAHFIDAPEGQCAAGQRPIWRFRHLDSEKRRYFVGAERPSAWPNDYTEWLGCIWNP